VTPLSKQNVEHELKCCIILKLMIGNYFTTRDIDIKEMTNSLNLMFIGPCIIVIVEETESKTTNVVIQQHSRKLLMMDILMSETC